MDDIEEARRLMQMVASQAQSAGPIEAGTVIAIAKVWAHIALAEATRTQTQVLERIAKALEERNAR